VVRHALRDFKDILRLNPNFRLSVNVTGSDLADAAFLPMLERSLEDAGVEARQLAIEITESSTARTSTAIDAIHQLRQRGHSVQIDDFGTGHSSLAYLKDLAVDTIKIDKAFIQAIGTESVTLVILPQILSLAKALNLRVIVEGIETEEQAAYFTGEGKTVYGQGWLFGRPVPAADFHRALAKNRKKDEVILLAGD
jgi:sensor c-di-GMP phosphodiesterase-like protein